MQTIHDHPPLWVGVEVAEATGSIALAGEVDVAAAAPLEAALRTIVAGGAAEAVLDLSRATFLDSRGLAALVAVAKGARAEHLTVSTIAPPGSEARVVLSMSGLGPVLGMARG